MSTIKFKKTVTVETLVNLGDPHWWSVSTEGDVEGRTSKDLGIHYGTLVGVSKLLAKCASWKLSFKWLNPNEVPAGYFGQPHEIAVTVDGIAPVNLARALKDLGVETVEGQLYGSVTIKLD